MNTPGAETPPPAPDERYRRYRDALGARRLPAALVDLDALERNVDQVAELARAGGKRVRVASKSVRCASVLRRVVDRLGGACSGVMAYAAAELPFLVARGHTDLLLAYPTAHPADAETLAQVNAGGALAAVAVDADEQLEALDRAALAAGTRVPVVIDLDVSYRPAGGRLGLHVGVRRSPIQTAPDALALAERIRARRGLRLHGLLAYEAQIAGLTDASPFSRALNPAKRWIKHRSRPGVEKLRADVVSALRARGFELPVVNGGGSGSLPWCTREPALTEVTAGSWFLGSHLFDYYRDIHPEPAAVFALQACRRPAPGIVTCHGGGYVASGEAGPDRLPVPYLPPGARLIEWEGAGEVQTPVVLPPGTEVPLGAPVFFRHAKAGELAEHFDRYLLVRGAAVEEEAPTYRGEGKCFL